MGDTVSNQSGGVDIDAQQVRITGDVVGGDKVGGDKVAGDKVGGDKVMGDKITYEAPKPIVPALHQLPPPPADFTGREADIAAILDDIAHGAVISGVRGMGGIGKTALALVLAERLRPQYPDAQFFIELRGASAAPVRAVDAMQAVIRAYHPTASLPDDATQVAALYQSVLADQRAIVLLDDARDAAQIRSLLPPKSCLVLITTRTTFAVPGLRVRKLETLSPVEARDLLVAIAPSLERVILSAEGAKNLLSDRPEILRRLTTAQNDTVPVVDVIAYLCGYLPLALRAAASLLATTPDLNPLTYTAQLRDERTRLTKIGQEGVDIDVEASLNLSYQQLSPDAARVFRQLSVFPASFDAAAEEVVCDDPEHTHLSQLVRLSLVEFDPHPNPLPTSAEASDVLRKARETGRYRLHDLVRFLAVAHLTEHNNDEDVATHLRHARHYLSVTQRADDLYAQGTCDNDVTPVNLALALFDREWHNIRIGQQWAAQTCNLDIPPVVTDYKDYLHADESMQVCDDYPNAGAHLIEMRFDPDEVIRWMKPALFATRILNNRIRESTYLNKLGNAYADLNNARRAIEFYKQRLIITHEFGNQHDEGDTLWNIALAFAELDEWEQAIIYAEAALKTYVQIEHPYADMVRQHLAEWKSATV